MTVHDHVFQEPLGIVFRKCLEGSEVLAEKAVLETLRFYLVGDSGQSSGG